MTHYGPLMLIAFPLLSVPILWAVRRLQPAAMGIVVASTAGLTLAGVVAMAPAVLTYGTVSTRVPAVIDELLFSLDGVGLVFALAATFVWTSASLYAIDNVRRNNKELRYHVTSLVTLVAMLGIVLAGDLITLYLFFEVLGLTAYMFVVHSGDPGAERAGTKYLVFTLLGGFSVLTGTLLVYGLGGGAIGVPLPFEAGGEGARLAAGAFLILGFGVKAGVLGLHIWLPDAYAVAPAPANALLSGVMAKAGAYGILRTVSGLFGSGRDGLAGPPAAALQGEQLALAVLFLGFASMIAGVVMALWQSEAKRLLAYSSVSQMGFILVGIGAAGYLGVGGGIGWAGTLLHVVNHGLLKALLFLGVGMVIHACGTGDLRRLGGLAHRMPWTFVFVLIAAAGIAGLPGLNGFVSKSVLHHALEYAEAHRHLGALAWAERLFTLSTVGTAAVLTKLIAMTFLGKPRAESPGVPVEGSWRVRVAMGSLAAMVVVLGVWPQVIAPVVGAALQASGLSGAGVERWLTSPISQTGDLRAALMALGLGVLVHLVAIRTRAYDHPLPDWLSLDRALRNAIGAGSAALQTIRTGSAALEVAVRRLFQAEQTVLVHLIAERTRAYDHLPPAPPSVDRLLLTTRGPGSVALGRDRTDGAALDGAIRHLLHREVMLDATVRRLGNHEPDRLHEAGAHPQARAAVPRSVDAATVSAVAAVSDQEYLLLATRRRIQRATRDIGLNVAVLFLVWLAILATVWLGTAAA